MDERTLFVLKDVRMLHVHDDAAITIFRSETKIDGK